jgi:hypothetical protein
MANLGDYAEKLALDWLMTTGTATRPAAWFLALFTEAPGDDGSGAEVSGHGYARQAVAFDEAATVGGDTSASNAAPVTFAASGGAWGEITHLAVFDAATGGNMLWHAALAQPRTIGDGDGVELPAGALVLNADAPGEAGPSDPPAVLSLSVGQEIGQLAVSVLLNGTTGFLDWIITADPNPSVQDVLDGEGLYSGTETVTSSTPPVTVEGLELTYGAEYYFAAVYRIGAETSDVGLELFVPSSLALESVYRQNWSAFPITSDPAEFAARDYTPVAITNSNRQPHIIEQVAGPPQIKAFRWVANELAGFGVAPQTLNAALYPRIESNDFDYIDILARWTIESTLAHRMLIGWTPNDTTNAIGLRFTAATTANFGLINRQPVRNPAAVQVIFSQTNASLQGAQRWTRMRISPELLQAKTWADGDAEPDWHANNYAADPLLGWRFNVSGEETVGSFGFWCHRDSNNGGIGNIRWYSAGIDVPAPAL